jgi:transposase
MGKSRRRFTPEFKREAVRMMVEDGRPGTEVAHDLGIPPESLYRWKKELQSDPEEAFRGQGNRTSQDEELRRLRHENARLRGENEFLKKVSAYFAKEDKRSTGR